MNAHDPFLLNMERQLVSYIKDQSASLKSMCLSSLGIISELDPHRYKKQQNLWNQLIIQSCLINQEIESFDTKESSIKIISKPSFFKQRKKKIRKFQVTHEPAKLSDELFNSPQSPFINFPSPDMQINLLKDNSHSHNKSLSLRFDQSASFNSFKYDNAILSKRTLRKNYSRNDQ